MSDSKNKQDFIVAWYNIERARFSFPRQILLAKTWIDICTKNEEYEMSAALQKEKNKVIKNYIQKKRSTRTLKQRFWYYFIRTKRKIVFLFK
jgi:hypothetical protein